MDAGMNFFLGAGSMHQEKHLAHPKVMVPRMMETGGLIVLLLLLFFSPLVLLRSYEITEDGPTGNVKVWTYQCKQVHGDTT
jgi:hypothetical protein